MSSAEYEILSVLFLTTVVSFGCLALPGYAIFRRWQPASDWHLGGNLPTSVLRGPDLVLVGLYLFVFITAWLGIGQKLGETSLTPPSIGLILGSSVSNLFLASLVPLALFWRINLVEFFGLRWPGWKSIFWIVPLFVVLMILCNVVLYGIGWHNFVQSQFGGKIQETVEMLKESNDPLLFIAMAFAAVIVAPIAEEIIFRGYLYPVAKRFTERWFATFFTGLLFGLIHFNFLSLPILAVMGVVLAILYEKSGSLWVPIACHAAFNGLMVGSMLLQKFIPVPSP